MKKILLYLVYLLFSSFFSQAQTLEQVTQNGNTTNLGITVLTYTANSPSFPGYNSAVNINSLNGLRINGTIASSAHNSITYQSGGGGGAAVGFYRDGSYGTGLDFYTNPTSNELSGAFLQRMRITQNGDIGIGTSAPRAVLDIGSTIGGGRIGCVFGRLAEGYNDGDGTFLGVRGYSTQGTGDVKSFGIEHAFYGQTNSSMNFYRGGSVIGGFLTFNTGDNSEKMRISANGSIGIGTTNPTAKLTVAGHIHSQEVKVSIDAGADYVFNNGYSLRPLDEVEAFIKINRHLPEIATATEMEREGVNLGELILSF